ncbi:MAG: hypothetical protein AB9866_28020 [Syntrophobacteraceae bacterium]
MNANPEKLYFDRELVSDPQALISRYDKKEFESPCRSTVPLLSLIKDGWNAFQELLAACNLPSESELHFEFTVDPPQGRGKASHTDIMIRSGPHALAIEAKWSEPRYQVVRDWLLEGNDPENRRQVLEGWLDLLQSKATWDLRIEAFSKAVYQMVHRASSACCQAEHPQLAYLQFSPLPDGQEPELEAHLADLHHLHRLLGRPPGFPFHLIEFQIRPTAAFHRMEGLPQGVPETADSVKEALHKGGLFEFEQCRLWTIDGPVDTPPRTVFPQPPLRGKL